MTRRTNDRRENRWFFHMISFLLIGLGIVFTYWPPYEFLRLVGHAFIISGILMATVDRFVKERFLREVSWDVSKYLIGYNLPLEIQDRIRDLMRTQVIRRDFELRYRLSRLAGQVDSAKLKLELEFSYELENVTNQVQPYQQMVAFERHDNPTLVELRCDSQDSKAVYFLDGSKLLKEKDDEPGVVEGYGKKIKLPPHNREKGMKYRIGGKYYFIVPEDYSDLFSFAGPTISVTAVAVEVPDDLEFIAPVGDVSTTKRWEYRRVFLPGEHIHVRWFKKR